MSRLHRDSEDGQVANLGFCYLMRVSSSAVPALSPGALNQSQTCLFLKHPTAGRAIVVVIRSAEEMEDWVLLDRASKSQSASSPAFPDERGLKSHR